MPVTVGSHRRVAVPFLDLRPSHEPLVSGLLAEIGELIADGVFTNGPRRGGVRGGGRGDLWSAARRRRCEWARRAPPRLIGLGIEPGDEVIVPANTFVATAEAVTQAGGGPVLVDVGNTDYNLDPEATEAAITDRTRFLLPVHLYGQLTHLRS